METRELILICFGLMRLVWFLPYIEILKLVNKHLLLLLLLEKLGI